MSNVQIKSRYDSNVVVYECEAPEGTQNAMRFALEKAVLEKANLRGANLRGAYLRGANTNLIGDRPYFSIGPVGSRSDNLTLWITEKGPLLNTGCFGPDTFEAFRSNLEREHPVGSTHRKEYEAAILTCEAHAALWTPKSVEA